MPTQNPTPTPTPSLRLLTFCQLLVGVVFAVTGGLAGRVQLGASIAVGAALMIFNIMVLGWSWRRLFQKKSIAWTSLIIVIKYAVLLSSIFYFAQTDWFSPLGAGLGILSFVVAALVMAVITFSREEKSRDAASEVKSDLTSF